MTTRPIRTSTELFFFQVFDRLTAEEKRPLFKKITFESRRAGTLNIIHNFVEHFASSQDRKIMLF